MKEKNVMKQQESLIEHFMDVFNKPTLREMSSITGIQLTRVFRLVNGSSMRLSEYMMIKEAIDRQTGSSSEINQLARQLQQQMDKSRVERLMKRIHREMAYEKLQNMSA